MAFNNEIEKTEGEIKKLKVKGLHGKLNLRRRWTSVNHGQVLSFQPL